MFYDIKSAGGQLREKINELVGYINSLLTSDDVEVKRVIKVLGVQEATDLADECLDLYEEGTYNVLLIKYQALYQQISELHKKCYRALLSSSSKVTDLITVAGDVHHIFPKEFLKDKGITDKTRYNQVANYAFLDTGVNISIGKRAPSDYFSAALAQNQKKKIEVGTITSEDDFWVNLDANCIPRDVLNMTADDYPDFLQRRRTLMAVKIREYYNSL